MAGLGGYLLLFSKYILVTEWKIVNWESKLYSHQGQDNFLGYDFLFFLFCFVLFCSVCLFVFNF